MEQTLRNEPSHPTVMESPSRRTVPNNPNNNAKTRIAIIAVACFTLFYFVNFIVRASAKYFWYDELCTVYISRLPDLASAQQAILHGVDFNPLPFHVLTRLVNGIFGEGLVSARLPAMVGVWLLCVSLFAIASRRWGWPAGVVAMLFPILSRARFYAYEARPHGIVLGLAGLAALAWQRLRDPRTRPLWLIVFAISLWGSCLLHCYAITLLVPFAFAESYRVWRTRKLDWIVPGIMAVEVMLAIPFYLPLLRAYSHIVAVNLPPVTIGSLQEFYVSMLSPAILALLACLVALALARMIREVRGSQVLNGAPAADTEIALALAFLSLPVAGYALAVVTRAQFMARYFASAILGVSLLAAYAGAARRAARWLPYSLAVVLAFLALFNFGRVLRLHQVGKGEMLVEPSSDLVLATDPGQPLADYQLLLSAPDDSRPILVMQALEFAYLANYAPARIKSRLYYSSPGPRETLGRFLRAINDYCHIPYNLAYDVDFLAAHQNYYVYGLLAQEYDIGHSSHVLGGSCRSLHLDLHHFLAEMSH